MTKHIEAYREPKRLPANWVPNDDLYFEAKTRFGMTDDDVHTEVPAFHAYNAANGTLSQDWDQTFRQWCKLWKENRDKQASPRLELAKAVAKKPEHDWPLDYLEQSDQPLVVTDVGEHRDQALFDAPRRDHDVPLDATVPISQLRCGFTDGHDEPVTPYEQLKTDFTWNKGVKQPDLSTDASSWRHFAPLVLTTAALALSAVGITINGWFARSLGSSEVAGWLFLAVGVAADLIALVMPSCAAGLWHAGQRATALVGWALWLVTFVFSVTAGIGFASTNISDVTLARASRVTPAVTAAQAALSDAMATRDRECKGGVVKFCREREAAVVERRRILDTAMLSVGQTADPQTEAAIRLVAWISRGLLRPAPEDFAMLRLILLALLPQIGGMLMMVGRHSAS